MLGQTETCTVGCSMSGTLASSSRSKTQPPISFKDRMHSLLSVKTSQMGRSGWRNSSLASTIVRAAAGKGSQLENLDGQIQKDVNLSQEAQLIQLGFSRKLAARYVEIHSAFRRKVDFIHTAQWLQLLRRYHVQTPYAAMCNGCNSFKTNARGAGAVLEQLCSMGLTGRQMEVLVWEWPALVDMPHEQLLVEAAWLKTEIANMDGDISKVATKWRSRFGNNAGMPSGYCWFYQMGFSKVSMTSAPSSKAPLFDVSSAAVETQLADLQALGLPPTQVAEIAQKKPALLVQILSSKRTQLKLKFLVEVMGKQATELVGYTEYLGCSLFDRIGPRWAFYLKYCDGQQFRLRKHLACHDWAFLNGLASHSMDAACAGRSQTRLQLYEQFRTEWQSKEGKAWYMEPRFGRFFAKADVSLLVGSVVKDMQAAP